MKKNTAARTKAYKTFSIIVITLLAISFAFLFTGSSQDLLRPVRRSMQRLRNGGQVNG